MVIEQLADIKKIKGSRCLELEVCLSIELNAFYVLCGIF